MADEQRSGLQDGSESPAPERSVSGEAGLKVGADSIGSRRKEKVGAVVSTKMEKTIVVQVEMAKAHPKYKRVMRTSKKFYAHDEQNSARVGDVVRIRETRPLSKLKRWQLEEIVRRSALAQAEEAARVGAK